jgi:acyl-ACP thioesterase
MSESAAETWSAPYRVRFDEAGPDGRLRTSVLLRYAQDLAWFHSAGRGFDREWYGERRLAWLVRAAEVGVEAAVVNGDELIGTTRVVGWRRVWARRRTEFRDGAGTLVGWTLIDWVLLDGRGVPTRIPPEFGTAFGAPSARFPLARVEIDAPPADAGAWSFRVRPHELDPMAHANNAVYADWLDEAVISAGDEASVRTIPRLARLEYARAAEPGVDLTAITWRAAGGWSFRLADAGGSELLRARLEPAPMAGPAGATADRRPVPPTPLPRSMPPGRDSA